MGETNWTAYGTLTTIMDTGLNSLAFNANEREDTTILDNTTPLDLLADFELVLASIDLSSQNGPAVHLWALHSLDGTNYEDGNDGGTDASDPPRPPDRIFHLRVGSGAEAKRATVQGVRLSPGKHRFLVKNKLGSGVAFPSSGNTLKMRVYSPTVA